MAFPSPATDGQTSVQSGYTYVYRAALKMWVKQSSTASTGVSVSNGSVTTGNTSISNTGVTTGNTSITPNGVTTGNTSLTSNGLTTGNTSVSNTGVTAGNTSLTSTGLKTGNTSVTPNGVSVGNTAVTPNGITTGNTSLTPNGLTTGNTSVTPNGVSVGNTAVTPNGVSTDNTSLTSSGVTSGNTSLTPNGITTGNTSLTPNGLTTGNTSVTPNGVSVGNTAVTPNGVSVGNTAVTSNGITTGNTSLSPNGLTTGSTSVTPNGVSVGNTSVTPNGVSVGNTSVTPNGVSVGNTSVTPNGVSVGNTSVSSNGITSGNTSLSPNGLTTGNTSVTPNGVSVGNTSVTPNGVSVGNTSVTPNGVSVGNTSVTPNGITSGNTSLTPNGLTTGNTSVTPDGVKVGNVEITPNGIVGNASSASKLQNTVNIALSGDTSGSVAFDGSQSVTISTTLTNTGVSPGTYTKVTVDGTGRVSNGANLSSSDLNSLLGYTPYSTNGGVIYGDATITGNFVVQGSTTQVNSVQTTLYDPIITLGTNSTTVADGKDRGVEFKYGTGSAIATGYFGYKSSTGRFTFIPSATNVSETLSGAVGTIDANLIGNVTGDLTGNVFGNAQTASALKTPRNIAISGAVTGNASFDGSADANISVTLADSGVSAGSYGSNTSIPSITVDSSGRITSASNVSVTIPVADTNNTPSTVALRDAAGNFFANTITANIVGNADTATAIKTARNITLTGNASGSASFDGTADASISVVLSNTGVTAGSFGSNSAIPIITVDSSGRITNASTASVVIPVANSSNVPNTVALRDASGNFAANTITANVYGNANTATSLQNTRNITLSGNVSGTASFNGTTDANIVVTIANSGVSAGDYGSNTTIPSITVDSSGRITNASNVSVTIPVANTGNVPNTVALRDTNGNFSANTITANVAGNANTATTLQTARNITLVGNAIGNATFDGSADANITVTLSNTGVMAGSYGSNTAIPVITVDSSGRVTNASNISVSFPVSNSGNVPNTLVYRDANGNFAANTITANVVGSASRLANTINVSLIGDITGNMNFDGSSNQTISTNLSATGVSAGTYGNASYTPSITVDAKGRVTSISAVSASPTIPSGSSSSLGGVKQGSGLTIAGDGTISLNTNIFANSLSLSNSPGGANTTVTIVGHGKVFNGNIANSPANIGVWDRFGGTYGDGRFLYISENYTQNIGGIIYGYLEYTDDGKSFSSTFTPLGSNNGIPYSKGAYAFGKHFYAVSNNSYLYITSYDTQNGSVIANTINTGLSGFGYISGVALTSGGGKIFASVSGNTAVSTDGVNWTATGAGNGGVAAYGMGRLVTLAVSGSYPNPFFSSVSTNGGVTWTQGSTFGSVYPSYTTKASMAYGNGVFVFVYGSPSYVNWTSPPTYGPSISNNIAYYSTDGLNWTSATLPSSQYWSSITYGAGYFVASAWGTSAFAYSRDGVNWTQGTLPFSSQWSAVNYGKGKFVFAPTGNGTSGYYQQTAVFSPEGLITLEAENAGSIDNVDIGINSPRAAGFTNVSIEGSLFVGGTITGNITASSASKLATARTINVAGDANGSTTFDGSANASISITLGNSGVTAGTYGNATLIPSITVDSKGRITNVTNTAIGANKVSLTGDATGTGSFDSSGNAAVTVTFSNSGVSSGTYGNASYTPIITVDNKGRVTSISTIASLGSGGGGVSSNSNTVATNYRTTVNFVANAGQTSFTFANYTINSIDVFRNGVRLDGTQGEYTATDGNTVVLTVAARANDSIVINSYNPPVANVSVNVGYATNSNAGLVQIGQNLSIAGLGQLSVPNATSSVAGVIKGGSDLSIDANAIANLATTTVTAGTYTLANVTVDSKGRITNAVNGTAVTSVALANTAGLVISGSPITSSGTISVGLTNTAVTAGTYSLSTITVDAQGRITNAVNGSALTISAYNTTVVASIFETVNVVSTVLSTTTTIPFTSGGIYYTTGNPSANFGFNFTGSGTTLNAQLAVNQSLTMTILVTSGATAYIPSTFQVDGNAVTPKWLGGTAPASGNANSIDAYTFTIIKTASAIFTVLASQAKYA